jgi:hypothetical protein
MNFERFCKIKIIKMQQLIKEGRREGKACHQD